MSDIKFNSQVCTNVEQSKRLLELGLKPETADMHITNIGSKGINYTDDWQIGSTPYCNAISFWNSNGLYLEKSDWCIYPAWSLHRLIELIPQDIHLDDYADTHYYLVIKPSRVLYQNDYKEW